MALAVVDFSFLFNKSYLSTARHIMKKSDGVIQVRMRRLMLAGICLLALGTGSFFAYNKVLVDEKSAEEAFAELPKAEQDRIVKEAEEFFNSLYIEGGFFDQVGEEMKIQGYESSRTMGMVYSKDDIRLRIQIPDREITEQVEKEVLAIFQDMMSKNDLDPEAFDISVSNEVNWEE